MTRQKLIELVDQNLKPVYQFGERNFEEVTNNPELDFFGYSKTTDDLVKRVALNELEKLGFVFERHGWLQEENIKGLLVLKKEYSDRIESLRFKNYHNIFSKKYWIEKDSGSFLDPVSLAGGAFFGGIAAKLSLGIETFLLVQGIGELMRRDARKKCKRSLNEICRVINKYNCFKENIENSKVYIHPQIDSIKIIEQARKEKETLVGKYTQNKMDFNEINRDLIKVYETVGL